jgi:hypothetical protein
MQFSGVLSRFPLSLRLFVLVFAFAGCGKTATTDVLGPSGGRCDVSVANNTSEVPASGGNGSLSVTVPRDCTWSAAAEASWITLSTSAGQGPASVNYSVLPNPSGTPRRGRIVVSEQPVEIAQAAASCRYEVSQSTVAVDAAQHDVSVVLTAPDGCRWSIRSDVAWIHNVAPSEGSGGATIRFTVVPNGAAARTGTVAIGDATVRVNQASRVGPAPSPATCTYDVSPTRVTVGPAGEQVAIRVTALAGCTWVASSSTAWIGITSGASGAGNGSIQVAVIANIGNARTGTITVANRTIPIEQAAAAAPSCSYRLADSTRNVGRDPEEFSVTMAAPAGCTWTVSSEVPWITVADGRNSAGSGDFRLAVSGNTDGPRTGTVRVATETFTVNQAGGACTYSIRPTYYNAGRGPDDITINVTAASGCAWTATTNATWVAVDAGRTGSGDGTVRLLVQPNSGGPRTAVVLIAGHTFTLHQEEGLCTTAIKPGSYHAGRGPDDIRIEVTTGTGCTWSVASTVSWVTVAEGARGSGTGVVRLVVQPNSGPARAVTLTIAGQPFALRQNGSQ